MFEMMDLLQTELSPKLSCHASIFKDRPSRWSTYQPPSSVVTVTVGSEVDVAETVQFCNEHGFPFVAQSGGNGWARFQDTKDLVLIDLSQLNTLELSSDKKRATIGGGIKVHDAIIAADAAGAMILTGNCNSAGVVGSMLAGGFGNLMGQHGFAVDNVLEMNVVTADGKLRIVSQSEGKDLFWAMRGAGPNFGIVTSATVKAIALPDEERLAWCGALIYSEDKLERVIEAIENLKVSSTSVVFLYFASSGPPSHTPAIVVTPWLFQGTPDAGKTHFKTLYDIGPMMEDTSVKPYTEWNTGADAHCKHGGRKPGFGAGLNKLDPKAWRQAWNKYCEFQKKPTAEASAVLLEVYPSNDLRFAGERSASFPHRRVCAHAVMLPWYRDEALDNDALACGKEIRRIFRESSGLKSNVNYVNFAHGDESLEEIYGDSLPRLRELKKVWDSENRFRQWFNIR